MSGMIPSNPVAIDAQETAIQQTIRGEAEVQAAVAHRFPRDHAIAAKRAHAIATANPDVAAACFYALPRGGRTIDGPSVRLAEILAQCWGNLRASASVIDIGEAYVTARGVCWDLESNYFVSSESRRRITRRDGSRYDDDMIGVTANAACSIAYREAVFKCIGRAIIDPIWQECRSVAVGESRSLSDSWAAWVKYYAKAGVSEAQILERLGKQSVSQIDRDDLADLKGLLTALRDGDTTLDEAFRPEPGQDGVKSFGFKGRRPAAAPQANGVAAPPASKQEPPAAPPAGAPVEITIEDVRARIAELKIDDSKVTELTKLRKEELAVLANHLGLDVRGNKGVIAERIAGLRNKERAESGGGKNVPLSGEAKVSRGVFKAEDVEPPNPPPGTSAEDMPVWDSGQPQDSPPPTEQKAHPANQLAPGNEPPPPTDADAPQQPTFGFAK